MNIGHTTVHSEHDTQLRQQCRRRPTLYVWFLANVNVLRYVCYMLSAVRLSSVCLSVTLLHPTQAVELFGNFFNHTIAQGLYFSGAKNRWWGTPLSP